MSSRTFVPSDGVFAVLKIDPIASLAYLDDPEATQAASKLTFGEYLVFVPGTNEMRHPAIAYRTEPVDFVVQGLPMDVPELAIDSNMSIPISSRGADPTRRPHREPLRLAGNNELPWADCYISSLLNATVRCATVISDDDAVRLSLDWDESYRRTVFVERDRIHQACAYRRLVAETNPALDSGSSTADSDGDVGSERVDDEEAVSQRDVDVDAFDPHQAELDGLTAEELQELEDQEEEQFLHELLTPREAPDELIAVTFTHDISRLEGRDLPNGGLFFVEKQNLMQIVEESFARKRKAVEDEADAMFAAKTAPRLAAHSEKAVETGPSIDGGEHGWFQKKLSLFRRVLCGRGAV
ncbi:hypothetical protein MKEN_00633000 [Mycena kentingensis (nom. inval.)]|nr:hypothetical protein MKEN_00633000 [Mycena kentingensis (nom. inval.)]